MFLLALFQEVGKSVGLMKKNCAGNRKSRLYSETWGKALGGGLLTVSIKRYVSLER